MPLELGSVSGVAWEPVRFFTRIQLGDFMYTPASVAKKIVFPLYFFLIFSIPPIDNQDFTVAMNNICRPTTDYTSWATAPLRHLQKNLTFRHHYDA